MYGDFVGEAPSVEVKNGMTSVVGDDEVWDLGIILCLQMQTPAPVFAVIMRQFSVAVASWVSLFLI